MVECGASTNGPRFLELSTAFRIDCGVRAEEGVVRRDEVDSWSAETGFLEVGSLVRGGAESGVSKVDDMGSE